MSKIKSPSSQLMTWYRRLSLVLAIIAVIAFKIAARGPFSAAHDGEGPDGRAIIALLLLMIAVVAVMHSMTLGVVMWWKSREREALWIIGTNLGLALLLLLPMIQRSLEDVVQDIQFKRSTYHKIDAGISKDPLDKFTRLFEYELKNGDDKDIVPHAINEAIVESRADILKMLESKGYTIVNSNDEQGWKANVMASLRTYPENPYQNKLETLRLLLALGERNSYSLQPYSKEIFEGSDFLNIFEKLPEPTVKEMYSLLVTHGADINDCDTSCALWFAARFGRRNQVEFLLSHGANVNQKNSSYGTTALSESISGEYYDLAIRLLNADAKLTHDEYHDDMVLTCDRYLSDESHKQQIEQLFANYKKSHAYITPAMIAAYHGSELQGNIRTCLEQFLPR